MRLLHLSDLHIGKRVNEFSMLEDQRFALEGLLDTARERNVDAIVVAGDLYDKATPSAEAVALVDWFFAAAADTGATVLAIAGNHDSAERVAYGASLLARQRVVLSPVYDGTVTRHTIEDEHGPVHFWLLPFLKPATVRPHFPEATIESYSDAIRCALATCPIDPAARNVVISHQFVTHEGASLERCESELSLGGLDNVDASVFDAFDYVALGHLHRPQQVARPEVRYSGSLLKYSFSEARDFKSAPLVELGPKGQVGIELVPVKPRHDLREIRGMLEGLLRPDVVSEADPEDYLSVVLTDEHPALDALDRLRRDYPNVMAVSYDNARSRARGLASAAETEARAQKAPIELFEEFYTLQNGKGLSETQRAIVLDAFEKAQVM